jgi:hypothetical protein
MGWLPRLALVVAGFSCFAACGSDDDTTPASGTGGTSQAGQGGAAGEGGAGGQSQGGGAGQTAGGAAGQSNGGSAGEATGGTGGGAATPTLVINEVDYDQISPPDDAGEFIEILNTGSAAVPLDGLVLVMVNGKGGGAQIYKEVELKGTLGPGAYLLLHDTSVVPPATCGLAISFGVDNLIQNGESDALVLVHKATNTAIDALGYEGSVAAMTYGTGTIATTEGTGTTAADSNTEDGSLVRFPNGTDSQNNDADFKYTKTPTPCADNVVN